MPMTYTTEYSSKEISLFNALGVSGLIGQVPPMEIYRFAIEKAFVKNWTGRAVESLRSVYAEYLADNISRMTLEWDNLINL